MSKVIKPTASDETPKPAPEGDDGFVPCRVYFKESLHAGQVSRASLDPVRDGATYNRATGIIRANPGGNSPFEMHIASPWGPTVFRV